MHPHRSIAFRPSQTLTSPAGHCDPLRSWRRCNIRSRFSTADQSPVRNACRSSSSSGTSPPQPATINNTIKPKTLIAHPSTSKRRLLPNSSYSFRPRADVAAVLSNCLHFLGVGRTAFWQQPGCYVIFIAVLVVEIKQRGQKDVKSVRRVTLFHRLMSDLRIFAQQWRYGRENAWVSGKAVEYLTRRSTNVELAERTAACFSICALRNWLYASMSRTRTCST